MNKSTEQFLLNLSLNDRYMFLGRMQRDCAASIGYNRIDHLWGINVKDHIAYMRLLWRSFEVKERPKLLKMKDIDEYERQLKVIEHVDNIRGGKSIKEEVETLEHGKKAVFNTSIDSYKGFNGQEVTLVQQSGEYYLVYFKNGCQFWVNREELIL